MGGILSDIIDGIVSAAFGWISSLMEKRGLVQQGKQEQRAADLESSATEAKDAAQISENVRTDDSAALDAGLERVRQSSGNP